jgi:hypothetical protein
MGTRGETLTTQAAVGAHQRHLSGGSIRAPLPCSSCHTVPVDVAHATQPLDLTWDSLARANGASATWNPTGLTCSNYCHGATLHGGTNTTPIWNVVDNSQAACGTCHGLPPPPPHFVVPQGVKGCWVCHPMNSDGTIDVSLGTHINGRVEVD